MICPGWTRSPTLTGRSITRPAMRKPSAASSCASMRPVSVTVEPASRLLTVTVRTGRTSGPRASSAGPQAESVKVARKGNTRLFKKRRGVALRTASNFARLPCLSFRDGERNGHIGLPPKNRREILATAQPRSPSHVGSEVKQGDASARCRRFVRSRQEVTGELFNALHGLERGAQADAVTPRQTSDRDPTGRRPAVLDVLDLLTEDQVEKGLLCVGEGIEVSLTAAAE